MWDAFLPPRVIFERRATWPELERELVALVAYGRRVDHGVTWWTAAAQVSFAGGFFAVPITFIAFFNGAPGIALAVPATLVALFAIALAMMFRLTDRRLETHRVETLLGWGRCVGRDASLDRPWSVRLDLRRTQSPWFERSRDARLDKKTNVETTTVEYAQEWLRLRGRLRDGSNFRLAIEQRVKSRQRPHRKGAKVRERYVERAEVVISGRKGEPAPRPDKAPSVPKRMLDRRSTLVARRVEGENLRLAVATRQIRTQRRGQWVNPQAEYQLVDRHVLLRLFLAAYRTRRAAQVWSRP